MSQSGWKQPSIKHHQRAIDVLSSLGRKLHSCGSDSAKVPSFPPPPTPSESKSLTSNLLERNQNVRRLCNLQAEECGLYFIYNFTLQISSFCLTLLDLQRLNISSPPPPPPPSNYSLMFQIMLLLYPQSLTLGLWLIHVASKLQNYYYIFFHSKEFWLDCN